MSSVSSPVVVGAIDIMAASPLVANMLAHAVSGPQWLSPSLEEAPHAREDNPPPSHETGLSVSAPIHDGPSPPSSREYRTPICPEGESVPLGLAGRPGADLGWRFGGFGHGDDAARRLQDLGRRRVDGQSRGGVCARGVTALAFQYRLASLAG